MVGKTGTRIDFGTAWAGALAGASAAVALPADEHPARAEAAMTAASTAAGSRLEVLIERHFLRSGQGGRD